MESGIEYLVRYGYLVLFLWVFAEQVGLPLPSAPFLLGAGALAGTGRLNLATAIAVSVAASLIADLVWYEIGRRHGGKVLSLLCSITLERDSCIRRTENMFAANAARTLILAKFVPGLNTAAPPLAGILGMSLVRFLILNGIGALVWAGTFLGLGFVFSDQIEILVDYLATIGGPVGLLFVGAFLLYLTWKFVQRKRFIRRLRMERVTPERLKQQMDDGHDLTIIDLRHPVELERVGQTVPGALTMSPGEIDSRHEEVPRDRDIVVFCSCPNEATAASVALKLHRKGITRVRPLAGGYAAWIELGYPLAAVTRERAVPWRNSCNPHGGDR